MGFSDDTSELAKTLALRQKVGIILGGLPSEQDTMPSVIFIILYASLFVPIFWRIRTHTLTFGQLWKPLVVVMLRIATFAMRIKLAEEQQVWNQDIFIAELIMLRIGPIILSSAMISLFRDAVLPYLPQVDSPNVAVKLALKYFVTLLNFATYFSLGLTIAVAFDVKQAINGSNEARSKMHRSKEISIWMMVAIDACIYMLTILPLILLHAGRYIPHLVINKKKEETKFMAILSVCTFLVVVSAFKAAQLSGHEMGSFSRYNIVINRKILFYCVCCTGEFIACMMLSALPWARIVPPPELLEAFCRIHTQRHDDSSNSRSAGPNAQTGMPWPPPPPPAATNVPGMTQEGGENARMRAPGGVYYADQVSQSVPRQAKVHTVTVPYEERRAYDDLFDEDQLHVQGHGGWTDIPVGAGKVTNVTPHTGPVPLQPNDFATRCSTPGPRRASSPSLSTISEVGEEKAASREKGRPTTMDVPQHSVLQRTDSLTGRTRSSSLDNLTLPPTLLPHAPPEVLQAEAAAAAAAHAMRRSRSLTSPHASPLQPQPRTPTTPVTRPGPSLTPASAGVPSPHQPLPLVRGPNGEHDVVTRGIGSGTVTRAAAATVRLGGAAPGRVQPSSACSIRSHWSDDSDNEDEVATHHHVLFGHKRSRSHTKTSSGETNAQIEWD